MNTNEDLSFKIQPHHWPRSHKLLSGTYPESLSYLSLQSTIVASLEHDAATSVEALTNYQTAWALQPFVVADDVRAVLRIER